MNEKYQQLYGYLSQNGMTDLDSDTFHQVYSSNKEKYGKLYSYLVQNKMTDLDSQAFYDAYFGQPAKKKSTAGQAPSRAPGRVLPGDDLVRQMATSPEAPVSRGVRSAQLKNRVLEQRSLIDIDPAKLSEYGMNEDDWRNAQIAYAVSAPTEEVEQTAATLQEKRRIQEMKEAKEKSEQAFIPQLLAETFPNSPNLYNGVQTLYDVVDRLPIAGFILDFNDDIVRGIVQGQVSNDKAAESFDIISTRGKKSMEQTNRLFDVYVDEQGFEQKYGGTEEAVAFSRAIEEAKRNGEDETMAALWAFAQNPSLGPQMITSSIASLFNKASITAASTTTAGFVAGGASVGALGGGVGAIPGAIAGAVASVPFAMGVANGSLEFGMTFPDLIVEEMEARGMELTRENFNSAINNDEIYNSVLVRAAARGVAISLIDWAGTGVGTRMAKKLTERGVSATGRTFAAMPVEGVFGGIGEFAGQVAAGQEISGAEIVSEAVAELGMAPIPVAKAMMEDRLAKSKPKYMQDGVSVDGAKLRQVVLSATPEELKAMNISVENDPEMSSLIDERMIAARVADGLPDYISPEDRRRIINLELERNKIGEAAFGTAQAKMNAMRMEEIDAEISSIVETAKANQPVAEAAQPVQTSVDAKAKKREEEIRKRGLDKLFPVDIDETTKEGKKLLEEKEAQEKAIAELDAELAALKQPVDIEAQKADIERRRQEELKERVVYDRKPTVEDGEFRIIGDPNKRVYRINENTGRLQVKDEETGLWTVEGTHGKIELETAQRSGFEKLKEIINAKYDAELSALEAAEAVQSEPATPPTPTPGQTTYIEDVINRPVTLVSFNGTPLEQPVQGDMYVDGQTLVVETPDRVYEIGNALELSPTPLAELGIEPQQETVTVGTDGTIQVEGESFLMQTQLPTMGIEYDADGNVTQVSLEAMEATNEAELQAERDALLQQKNEAIAAVSSQPGAKLTKKQQARVDKISAEFDAKIEDVETRRGGQKKTFTGQQAEDIAYQIMLSQAQTSEQAQRINEILEQDAELKRLHDEYVRSKTEGRVDKPRETQAAPQKRPAADTKKSTKPAEPAKPKSSPVREPEPPKPTELPKGLERLLRVLSIETNPVRMASYVHQIEEAVSRGVQLSAKMRAEVEAAKKIVADAGYTVETPGLGKDYVPDPSDEVVMITSSDIPDGEKRVVSIGRPRVLRNGKVAQSAKVVMAYGTGTPDKAMTPKQRTEAETLKNPRSKKQLQDTLERIFGLPKDKAKASAAIADKMVGTMAKRAGIKKEEMYGRINWMRSNSVDALGNSVPTGVEPVVLFQENIEISEWRITQDFFKNTAEFEQLKADGVFVDDASVKEIMDKVGVVFHAPDSMSGSKVKNGDTTILDGQGGVFYPILPGFRENSYFWASTQKAADRLTKTLNEAAAQARESGDGKVRLVLVTSPLEKLTSSTSANQAFVRLLKSFMEDKKSPLNKQAVKAALIAGNLRLGEKKKPLGAKVKASDSVDTMIQVILDKLEPENSTFDTRKAFFYGVAMSLSDSASKDKALRDKLIKFLNEFSNRKYWPPVNGTKNQQGKLSMTDIVAALSYAFTEPAIRDISPDVYDTDDRAEIHMVYAVVEVDVAKEGDTFDFVMTKEAGLPTHASYPAAIRVKNPDAKVTLKMFQDTIHARSLIINPKTGEVAKSEKEYMSLLPTNTGMSNVVSTTTVSTDPYDPAVAAVTKVEIDKEAIANGAKAEVDRIKGLPIETEDGSTFNIDGSMSTESSGLIVPVASLNTTQAELTPEMVADYIERMKEVFSTNDVKFGLFKFEDSDKVSIDINIMVPEDQQELAIRFGRFAGQNSIFRLSDFSTVKTGASGKNPRKFSLNQYAEIAARLKDNDIEPFIQNNTPYSIPEEIADALTDDGNGNYVFRHYSYKRREQIEPKSGDNVHTSRDEASAIGQVGGVAMYYVDSGKDVAADVPHIVKVPKDKVYYYNEDMLDLYYKARDMYRESFPYQRSFPSFNHELAWVTKAANELGFDMVIAEWSRGPVKLRAQTTMTLTPVEGDFNMKSEPRVNPEPMVGDTIIVNGDSRLFTGWEDRAGVEYITYEGEYGSKYSQPKSDVVDSNGNYTFRRSRIKVLEVNDNGKVVRIERPKQVYFQDARAAIVMNGSEAVIHAITDPDVTSPLHELAHLYETFLTDEERQSILDWAGHSEWTRDTSEAFAMGFEKYLYEGKTSVPALKTAFNKFRQWVLDVYSAISGTPLELELNDKMRSIYETMLSETEPENVTHVQNPDNGVYYQGPMNPQGQSTYTPSELSWFRSSMIMFRKKFQDRYADIMFLVDDVKKWRGGLSKSSDFRMAEDLMHGKTKNDMEAVEGVLKKAQEFMRKNGISSDDLSDYLYALHAPDRNASILASKGVVDGSGMSDAEAQDTRDRLIAKYGESVLEEAADYFRSMLASNRQVMIEFGLESQETIEQWEQTQTYVPLFGIATDEMDSTTTVYPTGGSGIHVYGPTSKRAKGRKSKATNVLANIVSASLALRIKARKNEALQTMYNLVQDNPSDIWSIKTESEKDDMHSVGVRIDGKQFYIRFKDAEKAKSLKNMGVDKTNFFNHALKVLPTSWLRKSFTVYDPEFVISNFIRDLESAILNIGVEGAKNGIVEGVDLTNEIAKIKKNVWPVMKTLVAMAHGRSGDPRIAQYYEDLKEDGGITGWVQLQTLGDIAKNIERELDPSAFHIAKDKAGAVFRYIEGINDAIEQTVRLTTYIAAVEAGVSREKAAQLSKNITVNFNRYGEYGITLNQFKLFFNASIQGSYRVLTTLGRFRQDRDAQGNLRPIYNRLTKSQKMAMGLFAMNAAITAWNIAMSEDDDDGESYYKKISDNDKQRHLIIMYDGQHFIKVPMAYGFNVITSASEAITSAAMGVRDADDAFWFTLSSTINAFSPIQFGDYTTWEKAVVTLITPSGASAIVEAALNETFMGSEVFREQLPFGTPSPENQLSFKSPMWLRDAASFINEMTGGSEYVPGDFDVNPDRLWHYLNFYVGGLGRFVGRSGEAILSVKEMAQSGRAIRMSSNDLPFLRKIYGEPSRYYDYKLFQENMIRSQQLLDEYQDPKARKSDRDRYGKIYVVESARKVAEKQLKELRAKMREAEKIEDYVTRRNRVFDLFEEQRQVMMRFNKIYNEKGPQED